MVLSFLGGSETVSAAAVAAQATSSTNPISSLLSIGLLRRHC